MERDMSIEGREFQRWGTWQTNAFWVTEGVNEVCFSLQKVPDRIFEVEKVNRSMSG